MNQKGFSSFLILAGLVILLICGALFFNSEKFLKGKPASLTEKSADKQPLTKESPTTNPLALDKKLSNFDHLSIEDLPQFADIRHVFPYKGNLLIAGFNKIVEYNQTTNEYIRVSNRLIKTINSTALIGDYLYVSSDRPESSLEDFPPKRQLYVIDLQSGSVIKEYFKNDPNRYANLMITTKDGYIWGSSWDGVFRLDPKTDQMKNYSIYQLGVSRASCPSGIFVKDNQINVLECGTGFSTYDEQSDSWSYRAEKKGEYASLINKSQSDFNLELPIFYSVSQKINEEYYLFADLGIYTVKKDSLPQLFLKAKLSGEAGSQSYVNQDKKYAVIIGLKRGMSLGNTLNDRLRIQLIELKNGQITELLKTNSLANQSLAPNQEEILRLLDDPTKFSFKETPSAIQVIAVDQNQILLTIDLLNRQVTF